jgi:hypothetical protein
MDRYGKAYTN